MTMIHFSSLGGPGTSSSVLFPSVVRYGVPIPSVGLLVTVPLHNVSYHFNDVKERRMSRRSSSREGADDWTDKDDAANNTPKGIDLNENPALYRVWISRRTGIEWGTDLLFAFVYVRELEPGGAADLTGKVQKGDQICVLRPYHEVFRGSTQRIGPVSCLAFHPNTLLLAAGFTDEFISIYSPMSYELYRLKYLQDTLHLRRVLEKTNQSQFWRKDNPCKLYSHIDK